MFKGKKMAGHMGQDRVTTQNLRIAKVDVPRGLILVHGAVPGSKGAWIVVKDAVKRPRPAEAPLPGGFRTAESNTPSVAPQEAAPVAEETNQGEA